MNSKYVHVGCMRDTFEAAHDISGLRNCEIEANSPELLLQRAKRQSWHLLRYKTGANDARAPGMGGQQHGTPN